MISTDDEMKAALPSNSNDLYESEACYNLVSSKIPPLDLAKKLNSLIDFDAISDLSENDVKDLIFLIKKLVLDIALHYSPNNKTRAMSTYGMRNLNSFKKLFNNPETLHPDKKVNIKRNPLQQLNDSQ